MEIENKMKNHLTCSIINASPDLWCTVGHSSGCGGAFSFLLAADCSMCCFSCAAFHVSWLVAM